jgi:hypothetical protein
MKLFSNLQITCPIINTHPFSRCTTCYTTSEFYMHPAIFQLSNYVVGLMPVKECE